MINSYSIKAIIRDDKPVKKNGRYPIYFLIRLGQKQIKIPVDRDIEVRFWDKKEGKAKSMDGAVILNQVLEKRIMGLREWINRHELEGKLITRQDVKDYFSGKRITSSSFIDYYLSKVQIYQGELCDRTIEIYNNTLRHLKEFRRDISFGELTLDFVRKFDAHLTRKGLSNSGKFPVHRCLRKVVKEAHEEDKIAKYPYHKFKLPKPGKREVFLTIEEVEKIRAASIPESMGRLHKVRDMFLFSCYTGLRYSDIEQLSWRHVFPDEKAIDLVMRKTKKRVKIPLLGKAKDIIRKYRPQTGKKVENLVFDPISNQKANTYLKELAAVAGINKHLTTHVARHTFASNLVEFGVPIIYIRDLLGHASLDMTQIYAKTNFEEIEKTLNGLTY